MFRNLPNRPGRIMREPLVQFLLGGGLILLLATFISGDETKRRILIDDSLRQRLSNQWQTQMGRPPNQVELLSIVDNYLSEELYYREALSLGLDKGDLIVRRRLAQKLRFLTEDLALLEPATQEELQTFYAAQAERYRSQFSFTFEQRLFVDAAGRTATDAAGVALVEAARGRQPTGVSSILPARVVNRPLDQVSNWFGEDFTNQLTAMQPSDAWQGPIESAYGWHLIRLTHIAAPEIPPFAAVAEKVRRDLDQQRRNQANEILLQELRRRYPVEWR